jgi:hypothetical protein
MLFQLHRLCITECWEDYEQWTIKMWKWPCSILSHSAYACRDWKETAWNLRQNSWSLGCDSSQIQSKVTTVHSKTEQMLSKPELIYFTVHVFAILQPLLAFCVHLLHIQPIIIIIIFIIIIIILLNTIIVFLDIIHHLFYTKSTMFWRLHSVSIFMWNLLSWAQLTELVPISGHV